MRLDGANPAGQRTAAALADGSYWTYSYDALSQATVTGADPRRLEFLYDAKGRRRSRTLYAWDAQAQTWTLSETRTFVYDQWNCIFGRRVGAAQTVTETAWLWGLDLSGSMQGAHSTGSGPSAGGIRLRTSANSGATARHVGGLLQASQNVGGALRAAIFHVYDGSRPRPGGGDGLSKGAQRATEGSSESEGRTATSGNVTALVDTADASVVARYDTSPFGMTVLADGPAAAANPYRFSSKEHDASGLVYYGLRYYSPGLGRWTSRDPIEEAGGATLFAAMANDPVDIVDLLGLLGFDVMEATVDLNGPGMGVPALGADPEGFEVLYTPPPGVCDRGQIVLLQLIRETVLLLGRPWHIDANTAEREKNQQTPGGIPIPAMGPRGSSPYSYVDSPSGGWDREVIAVAVCRRRCRDSVLDTVRFTFDVEARTVEDIRKDRHTDNLEIFERELRRWKEDGGKR